MNSQQKGKRFERELAKELEKVFSVKCKRTPQSGGWEMKGDIISVQGVPSLYHWECKCQESLNIWNALAQAERDCQVGKTPVVVFKRNFSQTYVALKKDDFINLLLELKEIKEV